MMELKRCQISSITATTTSPTHLIDEYQLSRQTSTGLGICGVRLTANLSIVRALLTSGTAIPNLFAYQRLTAYDTYSHPIKERFLDESTALTAELRARIFVFKIWR
ncbi:MAG: hypothetical protein R2834_10260 [Rhodothermales bacterium]